jgi:Spy/CpxP family protein refolding chaperone
MNTAGRKLPLVLIFSIGLNVAFIAVWAVKSLPERTAQIQPAPATDDEGRMWCPLYRQLGVDSVQWQQIEPRLRLFQAEVAAKRTAIAKLRAQMLEILASESLDSQELQGIQEEILACQGQMQVLVVSHLLAEKQLLTPEQRSKLFKMMQACCQCPPIGATLDEAEPATCIEKAGNGVGNQ